MRLIGGRLSQVFLAALVLLACAGIALAAGPDQNQPAAASEASALLAAAQLPDGAATLKDEPAGDGGALAAPPMPASPLNVADKTAFYRSSLSVSDVIAFVEAHPPSDTQPGVKGSADTRDGRTIEFRGFDKPPVAHRFSTRRLLVSAVTLDDGGTGIRVDAQVAWLAPRPTATLIRGARFLTINAGSKKVELDKPVLVRRLARMLNQADFEPQVMRPCERTTPEPAHPRLTFRSRRGGTVLGYAHVRPTGCARADLVVGGKRYQSLDLTAGSGAKLLDALRKLGVLPREAAAKQRS